MYFLLKKLQMAIISSLFMSSVHQYLPTVLVMLLFNNNQLAVTCWRNKLRSPHVHWNITKPLKFKKNIQCVGQREPQIFLHRNLTWVEFLLSSWQKSCALELCRNNTSYRVMESHAWFVNNYVSQSKTKRGARVFRWYFWSFLPSLHPSSVCRSLL